MKVIKKTKCIWTNEFRFTLLNINLNKFQQIKKNT